MFVVEGDFKLVKTQVTPIKKIVYGDKSPFIKIETYESLHPTEHLQVSI